MKAIEPLVLSDSLAILLRQMLWNQLALLAGELERTPEEEEERLEALDAVSTATQEIIHTLDEAIREAQDEHNIN